MECVHLKEQPGRHSTFHTNCIFVQRDPRTSYFKTLSGVPEVTSMQVFKCIGEEWKSTLQISLLEVCLPRGVQRLRLATFFRLMREVDLARLSPRMKRAQSDCNPWMSKMVYYTLFIHVGHTYGHERVLYLGMGLPSPVSTEWVNEVDKIPVNIIQGFR
jgi:hypothetical protein